MPSDAGQPRFGAEDVIWIASKLTVDDATFVVGGQATNLWAWLYEGDDPALSPTEPLTSGDIDYFGSYRAAQAFATALGGTVHRPDADTMNSPNTALVKATLNGQELVIDFLNGVLGVSRRELETGVSVLRAAATVDGREVAVDIPVMHPVLCLKSRVANMLHPATTRRDPIAWAQLHAAIAVVVVHIRRSLQDGNWQEAKDCLQDVFAYLRSDAYGRRAPGELGVDLIAILRCFENHPSIDGRYLENTLRPAIARLEERQLARTPT